MKVQNTFFLFAKYFSQTSFTAQSDLYTHTLPLLEPHSSSPIAPPVLSVRLLISTLLYDLPNPRNNVIPLEPQHSFLSRLALYRGTKQALRQSICTTLDPKKQIVYPHEQFVYLIFVPCKISGRSAIQTCAFSGFHHLHSTLPNHY